jgi:hypothetical protein
MNGKICRWGHSTSKEGLVVCFSKIHNMKANLKKTHLPLHACTAMLEAVKRTYDHN